MEQSISWFPRIFIKTLTRLKRTRSYCNLLTNPNWKHVKEVGEALHGKVSGHITWYLANSITRILTSTSSPLVFLLLSCNWSLIVPESLWEYASLCANRCCKSALVLFSAARFAASASTSSLHSFSYKSMYKQVTPWKNHPQQTTRKRIKWMARQA